MIFSTDFLPPPQAFLWAGAGSGGPIVTGGKSLQVTCQRPASRPHRKACGGGQWGVDWFKEGMCNCNTDHVNRENVCGNVWIFGLWDNISFILRVLLSLSVLIKLLYKTRFLPLQNYILTFLAANSKHSVVKQKIVMAKGWWYSASDFYVHIFLRLCMILR
jgi:hypothetical protein